MNPLDEFNARVAGEEPPTDLFPKSAIVMGEPTEQLLDDLQWAYSTMHADVAIGDAPTPSAWSLRQWAQEDIRAFMTLYARHFGQRVEEDDAQRAWEDDRRTQFALIDRLLDE